MQGHAHAPCCTRLAEHVSSHVSAYTFRHLGSIAHGGFGSDKAVHTSAGRKSRAAHS